MKIIRNIFCPLLFACLAISCSNNDYMNIIPQNAKAVVEVDIESLLDEYDFSDELIDRIQNATKVVFKGANTDIFMKILERDDELGIDFDKPFYLYVLPGNVYGATFKVDDIDDVNDLFDSLNRQNISGKVVDKDDIKWTDILDDVSVVYNDKLLAVLFSDSITETMNIQSKLLTNQHNECFVNSDKFDKLNDMEGPVKWVFNSDFFYDFNKKKNNDYLNNLNAFLPEGVRPVDVAVAGDLIFDKGNAVVNLELFSTNKKVQKTLEKEDGKFLGINGDFIGAPNDFLCWMAMGTKGEDLNNKLKQFNNIKKYLNVIGLAIDIESIVKAVKGDLAVVIPGTTDKTADNKYKEFVITAKLKNDDFLKSVSLWNDQMVDYGMKMEENAKNSFTLYTDSFSINWGVDKDNVYFASGNSFFKSAFAEKSDKLEIVQKDIKKSVLYVYVNMESLFAKQTENNEKADKLNVWDYFALSADNYRQYKLEFVLKDKDKDVLNILPDLI